MEEQIKEINRLMSIAFLLSNLAYTYISDAEDLAVSFGGFKHALKLNLKKGKKGLEEYMSIVRKESDKQGKTLDFFADYERLESIINDFIGQGK